MQYKQDDNDKKGKYHQCLVHKMKERMVNLPRLVVLHS